jgi:hypothetical protein
VNLPVARGPLPPGAVANSDLLDPTRGLLTASSDLSRPFAMLGKLGSYDLTVNSALLDGKWAYYRDMGLYYFSDRRTPLLYAFQKADPAYEQAYVQAVVAILFAPCRPARFPLDRDDEFIYYNTLFGWGSGSPDFYPQLIQFCSLDPAVADLQVQNLIDRIQGNPQQGIPSVAKNMAQAFIALYEQVIYAVQHPNSITPPLPPGQLAALQGQVPTLQNNIDQLEEFLMSLGSSGG